MADGVADEILQYPLDQPQVHLGIDGRLRHIERECQTCLCRHGGEFLNDVVDQIRQAGALRIERIRRGFEQRQLELGLHQAHQPLLLGRAASSR